MTCFPCQAVSWHTCMVNMLTCSLCPHLDTHKMSTSFPNNIQVFIVWWIKQCNSNTISFLLRWFESWYILLMFVSLYFSPHFLFTFQLCFMGACIDCFIQVRMILLFYFIYKQTQQWSRGERRPLPEKKEWTEVNSSFFLNKTSAGCHLI